MTIEELFGTLQQAVVGSWRKHLRTAKYGKHVALNDFYEELPDLVDALIEGYMGATGKKIKGYDNIIQSKNMNTLTYLQELKKICKQGYELLDDNEELEGLLDDIVNLINSTLYKVKELSEHQMMDLKDFVNEALLTEAKISFGDVAQFVAGGALEPDVMDEKTFVNGFDWKKLAKNSNSKYDGDHLGYYAPLNHVKDEINTLSTYLFSLDYTDYENAEGFADYINAEITDCLKDNLIVKCIWNKRDIVVMFWKDNKAVARLVFRPKR
jgi:hypothetical protein